MRIKYDIFFYLLLMISIHTFSSVACAQDEPDNGSAGQNITVEDQADSSDTTDDSVSTNDTELPEAEVVAEADVDQEHYRRRVRYEVITSAIILLTFFFFVALISMMRFKRNLKQYTKIEKDKKLKYQDVWGNPRVQQDDMPTDKEMQGIDLLDDEEL